MNAYECRDCKLAVLVLPDAPPVRACACKAPIVCNMDAVVTEHGGFSDEAPREER